MTTRRRQLVWLLTALFVVLVADQVTKAIVIAKLEPGTPFRDNTFFYFSHQRNTGLVGGMFSDVPAVAMLAPIFATGVLIYLFRHLDPGSRWQALGYGMVVGGAIGNLIDRVRLHSVTDFLQFHFYFIPFDFPWKFYPAFNIADSGICVGVAILMIAWSTAKPEDAPSTT